MLKAYDNLTYVHGHLVSNFLVEAFLLLATVFLLGSQLCLVGLHLLEVLAHHDLVEIFLLENLVFVALQGLFPGYVLGRICVLDDPWVLLWLLVATVMECLDLACHYGVVAHQAVCSQVDRTVLRGVEAVGASRRSVTVPCHSALRTGGRRVNETLRFSDQIVLEISSHSACELFAVLLKQLTRDEWEEIKFVFDVLLLLSLALQFVVQLFLIVEKLELVLEDL